MCVLRHFLPGSYLVPQSLPSWSRPPPTPARPSSPPELQEEAWIVHAPATWEWVPPRAVGGAAGDSPLQRVSAQPPNFALDVRPTDLVVPTHSQGRTPSVGFDVRPCTLESALDSVRRPGGESLGGDCAENPQLRLLGIRRRPLRKESVWGREAGKDAGSHEGQMAVKGWREMSQRPSLGQCIAVIPETGIRGGGRSRQEGWPGFREEWTRPGPEDGGVCRGPRDGGRDRSARGGWGSGEPRCSGAGGGWRTSCLDSGCAPRAQGLGGGKREAWGAGGQAAAGWTAEPLFGVRSALSLSGRTPPPPGPGV